MASIWTGIIIFSTLAVYSVVAQMPADNFGPPPSSGTSSGSGTNDSGGPGGNSPFSSKGPNSFSDNNNPPGPGGRGGGSSGDPERQVFSPSSSFSQGGDSRGSFSQTMSPPGPYSPFSSPLNGRNEQHQHPSGGQGHDRGEASGSGMATGSSFGDLERLRSELEIEKYKNQLVEARLRELEHHCKASNPSGFSEYRAHEERDSGHGQQDGHGHGGGGGGGFADSSIPSRDRGPSSSPFSGTSGSSSGWDNSGGGGSDQRGSGNSRDSDGSRFSSSFQTSASDRFPEARGASSSSGSDYSRGSSSFPRSNFDGGSAQQSQRDHQDFSQTRDRGGFGASSSSYRPDSPSQSAFGASGSNGGRDAQFVSPCQDRCYWSKCRPSHMDSNFSNVESCRNACDFVCKEAEKNSK